MPAIRAKASTTEGTPTATVFSTKRTTAPEPTIRARDAAAAGWATPTDRVTTSPPIGDISILIEYLFICGGECSLDCVAEADANQSGGAEPATDAVTIADISLLIDYLFITGFDLGLHDCREP